MWDNLVAEMLVDEPEAAHILRDSGTVIRPWPPVMIRDFIRTSQTSCRSVSTDFTIGHIADYLSSDRGACVAVYDDDNMLLGIAVDDDAMALIKRDGLRALDEPVATCIQRGRPICSVTDSPYVVLGMMKDQSWDRVGVSEHGRVVGIVHRRDLVRFCDE